MTELSLNLEAYCHELFIYPFLDNVLYKKQIDVNCINIESEKILPLPLLKGISDLAFRQKPG
jgi:hypothetical protein